jgi:predicted cupin superfamily sugar epimerase
MHPRAEALVRQLGLQPHPEGGYYREVFRSTDTVLPEDGRPARSGLTTIYFLLADGGFSRWHRVAAAEAWHFYEGDPLELVWLEDGEVRATLGEVGPASAPVAVVPAGCWQAARTTGAYTLVGCSVGPGFDFADFRMLADDHAERDAVLARFPEAAALL